MHGPMPRGGAGGGDAITEQLNREELARIQGGAGAMPPPPPPGPMPDMGPPPGSALPGPRPSGH
jgi:hypothetical protein